MIWRPAARLCYPTGMPPPRGQLRTDDLTAARTAYEAGAAYRELAARYGCAPSTVMKLLHSVGVVARPAGGTHQRRAPRPAVARPRRQRVVAVKALSWSGMRIPCRTPAEQLCRRFSAPEMAAIAQALAAGRFTVAPRGRSGLPEVRGWREASQAAMARFFGQRRAAA